jgi:putative PIN family toxin of toxin-antitoxin system
MRIVIDTNVFVSALLKEYSTPRSVIAHVSAAGGLLKSVATEDELRSVTTRPHLRRFINATAQRWLDGVTSAGELVSITERIIACRDPKDDKFLELAISGGADVIVSGDADLLALHPFRGIPIETPAAFLRRIGQR